MLDSDTTLNHFISFEVYNRCVSSNLKIFLNNELMFEKEYDKEKLYKEDISFLKKYKDIGKNYLRFKFSAETDCSKKYLKISSIEINKQKVDIFSSTYNPIINQSWWTTLSDNEKELNLEKIYGKNGGVFGWYGTIDYEYLFLINKTSYYKIKRSSLDQKFSTDIDNILDKKVNKVYKIQNENYMWDIND